MRGSSWIWNRSSLKLYCQSDVIVVKRETVVEGNVKFI